MIKFLEDKPLVDNIIHYGAKSFSKNKNNSEQYDYILTVTNKNDFHKKMKNIQQDYYPSKLGIKLIQLHNGLNCKIDYLVYIPFDGNYLKLGIVNTNDFLDNLINWYDFPTAARLQKPIDIIKSSNNLEICNNINITNTFKYNLITLNKNKVSLEELFTSLINLSYANSFRSNFKLESTSKITDILYDNYDFFVDTYLNLDYGIKNNDDFVVNTEYLYSHVIDENTPATYESYFNKHRFEEINKLTQNYFKRNVFCASTELIIRGTLINGYSKTKDYYTRKRKKYLDSII